MKRFFIVGASSGIGLAIADHLCGLDHKVWASAPDRISTEELRHRLPKAKVLQLDLREESQIEEACLAIQKEGTLDGLICNAGIAMGGPMAHLDLTMLKTLFEINLFGHLAIIQKLIPLLEQGQDPRLIWTGSAAGYFVRPLLGGYAASKFAVSACIDALRVELLGKIRVCHIAPGRIKTDIWNKGAAAAQKLAAQDGIAPYKTAIAKLKKEAEDNAIHSPPVEWVVQAMHHALFSSRPKICYRIGFDAKIAYWLKWLLPTWIIDRLLRKLCW
jgi:NAD(P)-dependent dehydrogenase (short-subunit alcohol dehydrogenase family)